MLSSHDGAKDEEVMKMWKDGMKCIECKQKDRIYFEDFQSFFKGHDPAKCMMTSLRDSLRDSGSLMKYSQSSFEYRASGGLNTRMNSARILDSALPLKIGEDSGLAEAALSLKIGEDSGLAESSNGVTNRMPSRMSISGAAFLMSSQRNLISVSETEC